jgi:hypothetical protein
LKRYIKDKSEDTGAEIILRNIFIFLIDILYASSPGNLPKSVLIYAPWVKIGPVLGSFEYIIGRFVNIKHIIFFENCMAQSLGI